jgi:hypothetical protein
VGRLAGERVLAEIREFFELIADLSAGFRERSDKVAELLRAPETAYWLVADANAPERNDLLAFLGELRERGMAFSGFLVNRVQPVPEGPWPDEAALRAAGAGIEGWDEAVAALLHLPESAAHRARLHREAARALANGAGGAPAWLLPELPGGVRSVDGLRELSSFLPPHPPGA